jgi:hypothetical protein
MISKAELNYETLYILPLLRKGEILSYETQPQFTLWEKSELGRKIRFTPDFLIECKGKTVIVEMKSAFVKKYQRDFMLRWRRLKELHPEYEYRLEKSEDWS